MAPQDLEFADNTHSIWAVVKGNAGMVSQEQKRRFQTFFDILCSAFLFMFKLNLSARTTLLHLFFRFGLDFHFKMSLYPDYSFPPQN